MKDVQNDRKNPVKKALETCRGDISENETRTVEECVPEMKHEVSYDLETDEDTRIENYSTSIEESNENTSDNEAGSSLTITFTELLTNKNIRNSRVENKGTEVCGHSENNKARDTVKQKVTGRLKKDTEIEGRKLIDFLKTDFNSSDNDKDISVINDEDQDGIVNYARVVVELYTKFQSESTLCEMQHDPDMCPFCDIAIDTRNEFDEHIEKHLDILNEKLEVCTVCNVVLPKDYLRLHFCTCTKKHLKSLNKVKIRYRDIRDFVAFFEMKHRFWPSKPDIPLKCIACNAGQTSNSTYLKHFLQNHFQTFHCECQAFFSSGDKITCHTEPFPVKDYDNVKWCLACKKKFSNTKELNKHMESFHKISGEYVCKNCGSMFACQPGLDSHKCVQKSRECRYHCKVDSCKETFPNYRACMKHRHEKHGIKKYLCNVCGQKFLVASMLKSHQEWAHGIGDSRECNICHQVFRGPNTLRSHMFSHTTEVKYNCELCGKVYKYRSGLKVHMDRVHTEEKDKKVFTCDVCEAVYSKKSSLNHHIVINNHTSVNQMSVMKKAKKCIHCGKLFGCNLKLQRHVGQVHIRGKKLSCQYCGKGFDDSSNLRQHIQTHTGAKPSCDICKMFFRSRRKLCEHMMGVHNIHMELSKSDPLRIKLNKVLNAKNKNQLNSSGTLSLSEVVNSCSQSSSSHLNTDVTN